MNVDRLHDSAFFTEAEFDYLVKSDRIFAATGNSRRIFPKADFFVCVRELESESVFDAWPVDSSGRKLDGYMPLRRENLLHLDRASDASRKVIAELAGRGSKVMKTYVFATSQNPYATAIGDGFDAMSAMEVASRSLRRRFPNIKDSPLHEKLLSALQLRMVVSLFETTSRDYAESWNSDSISGYASSDTYLLAQALSSDGNTIKVLADLPKTAKLREKVTALRNDIRLRHCFLTESGRIDTRWVDWVEVLSSLDEDVETQSESMGSSQTVSSSANEVVTSEFDGLVDFVTPSAKGRKIDEDVRLVLGQCVVDGNLVRLPVVQLEKKLYSRVNDVLVALGGKWTGGKTMAHKFKESPEAQLALAVSTGTFLKPQDFGFFPTPLREVEMVLKEARIEPGMLVAEPSAGKGAIALKAAEVVGLDNVHVFELLGSNVKALRELGFTNVHHGDFLEVEPSAKYDLIIMNPPFGGGADVEHVQHAAKFLKSTGRLVAITSKAFEHNSHKKFEQFREFVEESSGIVQEIEAGAFRESGTNIETRVISFDAKNFPWNVEVEQPDRMRG